MAILFYSTVFLVCLCRVYSQTPAGDSQVWTHRAILDREGKVDLLWTPRLNDIIFELHVQTLGWVGWGLSPNGTMVNADMAIGWIISSGEPTLQDRYSKDHSEPSKDTQQNYNLLSSYENATHTVFRFQRLYDTCDSNDTKITNSTMSVIYAYSNDDPVNEVIPPHYFVGHRNLILTGMQNAVQGAASDSKPFEMRLPNITISKTDNTLCWQKVFKYVPLSSTEVATSIVTLWKNNTAPFVDHVWLYKCDNIADTTMWDQYASDKGSICSSTDAILQYGNCTKMFGTAAAGSLGYTLGNNVGYQLNHGSDGPSYFLVKVAYSGWKLEEDVQDDTGIAISFSTEHMLVPGGTLTIGHELGLSQIVPKDQKAFMTVGHCDGECTKNNFPSEGIYVYEVFLDAKNAGRKVTVRHMRNGIELEPIVKDDSFISISQTYRTIAEPINILPGDNLIVECTYDTTNATSTIVGGIQPDSESCRAYLNYFPLVELQSCSSSPPLAKIFEFLKINQIAIDAANITYNDTYPSTLNAKLMDYAKNYNWEANASEYQDLVKSTYTSVCSKRNNEVVISEPKTVPKVEHPFYEISHCDVLIGDNSSAVTGTQTFPSPGTQTFPDQGTQTFPDQGTQTSPDQGTHTSPDQGTHTFPDQGVQTSPDSGTQSFPAPSPAGVSPGHDTSDPMLGDGAHMGEHGTSGATMAPDHTGNGTESNEVEVHGNHSASTQQGGSANSLKHTTSQIVGLIAIVLTVTLFANRKM